MGTTYRLHSFTLQMQTFTVFIYCMIWATNSINIGIENMTLKIISEQSSTKNSNKSVKISFSYKTQNIHSINAVSLWYNI